MRNRFLNLALTDRLLGASCIDFLCCQLASMKPSFFFFLEFVAPSKLKGFF